MYLEQLHIKNFRCFADTSFELNYPGREPVKDSGRPAFDNVNLFLGGNGSGKSSVFRAAILAILFPIIHSTGFVSDYNVRRKAGDSQFGTWSDISAQIKLNADDYPPISDSNVPTSYFASLSIDLKGDIESVRDQLVLDRYVKDVSYSLYKSASPAFFLAAYSTNRRTERVEAYNESGRLTRYQRVAGLFESHVGLVPIETATNALARVDRFHEVVDIINRLIGSSEVRLSRKASLKEGFPSTQFEVRTSLLPFGALSDGYRTFIGWVLDLLYRLAQVAPDHIPLTDLKGVVIVDEIDLFLHPQWQRTVIEQVVQTFPNLQFLFSTHSPLVAGSVESSNIYIMEEDENDRNAMVVSQFHERIQGLSADQILTGSYFGLATTRSQPIVDDLYQLATKAVGGQDPAAAVEYLKRLQSGSEPDRQNLLKL